MGAPERNIAAVLTATSTQSSIFRFLEARIGMVKTDIEALTKRIEMLEAQIGKHSGEPLVNHMVEFSNDLGNSLAGNERILPLMKRLEELETYLDPLFGEKEVCSLGVKMSLVENQFEAVRENQDSLEKLEELKRSLEKGNLSKMEELRPRVIKLSSVQLEQRELGESATEQTLELVQKYNDIISSLTEAFIQADTIVTKAEQE